MIELSPETACMIYVGGLLFLLMGSWIAYSYSTKHKEVTLHKNVHHVCEFCSTPFIVDSLTIYHRCPNCQCLNTLSKK